MAFDLLIKNGKIILEDGSKVTNSGVQDEKIVEIDDDLSDAKEVIDAEGLIVSPGMVDAHVHICEPGGAWEGYGANASKRLYRLH